MAVVANAFETKGTNLYFVYDDAVMKLTCPTGITGVGGGTRDRIDTTCLDETGAYRTYVGGFADADVVNVPFVLYDGDASQAALIALQSSNEVVSWQVALSDSTAAPTLDSDNNLVPAGARTTFTFPGYVANLTFDAAVNEVVRGTLSIQPSGTYTYHAAV